VSDDSDLLRKRERHLFDLYDAIGVKWGDDPFVALRAKDERIKELRSACDKCLSAHEDFGCSCERSAARIRARAKEITAP
jgi:hypothetical protein